MLHPLLPVDVRYVGAAAAAGAAAYAYVLSSEGGDGSEEGPAAGREADSSDAFLADEAERESEQLSDNSGARSEVAGSPLSAEQSVAEEPAPREGDAEDEDPLLVVDSDEILGPLHEVFSMSSEQILQPAPPAAEEVEEGVERNGAEPPSKASKATIAASTNPNASPSSNASSSSNASPSSSPSPSSRASLKASSKVSQAKLESALSAIQGALAPTAGESMASELGRSMASNAREPALDRRRSEAAVQAALAVEREARRLAGGDAEEAEGGGEAGSSSNGLDDSQPSLSSLSSEARAVLHLEADLSAAGLLASALRQGAVAADDWDSFPARHVQAQADEASLAAALGAAAERVRAEQSTLRGELAAARDAARRAGAAAEAAAGTARAEARAEAGRTAEAHRRALERQAAGLAAQHAEALVRERLEQSERLAGLRTSLGALDAAFGARAEHQRETGRAQRVALGALELRAALQAGAQGREELNRALGHLREAGREDALVKAALEAEPLAGAAVFLTPEELERALLQAAERVRIWGRLPAEGRGGLLTLALARLAHWLSIDEAPLRLCLGALGTEDGLLGEAASKADASSEASPKPSSEPSPKASSSPARREELLAKALALARRGKLQEAASALEGAARGTPAAEEAGAWARAARDRQAAEQLARLLGAHAAAVAASLV